MNFYLFSLSPTFLIFCCVGLFNTSLNYSVFLYLISYIGLNYIYAGALGFLAGAISGFFLNRKFTFNNSIRISRGLSAYLLLQSVCLILNGCIQFVVVQYFFMPSKLSQLPAIAVTLLLNYVISKRFIFLKRGFNESRCIKG